LPPKKIRLGALIFKSGHFLIRVSLPASVFIVTVRGRALLRPADEIPARCRIFTIAAPPTGDMARAKAVNQIEERPYAFSIDLLRRHPPERHGPRSLAWPLVFYRHGLGDEPGKP
jgi:hypothetical protein